MDFSENQVLPEVSLAQRTSRDILKEIRKLRWVGMDDKADQLEGTLRLIRAADVVIGRAVVPE